MAYTIRAVIDLTEVQELQRDEPLAVAVVRGGRVLGVSRLALRAVAQGKIQIEVGFDLPPGESPEGVELHVAPDIPDAFLGAADAHVVKLDPETLAKLKPGAIVDLGPLRISDAIYKLLWLRCRRYTVRGRVVRRIALENSRYCDEPVPGATVELYDVDRVCFWYRRDLITTATTDIDGNFSATFRWCCRPWIYLPHNGWVFESGEWAHLRDLLRRLRLAAPRLPIPIPEPDPLNPIELTSLFERLEQATRQSQPGPALTGGLPAGRALPGDVIRPIDLTLPVAARRIIDQIFLRCPPEIWRRLSDCQPDLLFRAVQVVEGTTREIYAERIADTRWNVPPTPDLQVLLLANDQAFSLPTCGPKPRPGDCLWFTGVGDVQITEIGGVGETPPLAGYERVAPAASLDRPFGGVMHINGLFGLGTTNVDYYSLQVAPRVDDPTKVPTDPEFVDVPLAHLSAVHKAYLGPDPAHPGFPRPVPVTLGPTSVGGVAGVYRSMESIQREYEAAHGGTPPGPWGWLWSGHEWLAAINSGYLPNNLYAFRVIGYTLAGGALVNQRIMRQCTAAGVLGPTELLNLRLDNRPLTDITVTGLAVNGAAVADFACREIELRTGDKVTVQFRVNDPEKHLSHFGLGVHYRIDCQHDLTAPAIFTSPNTYAEAVAAGAPRPAWGGGSYSVTVPVAAHDVASPCSSCGDLAKFFQFSGAYDLRPWAWKRTTNGFGLIFYNEANAVIVVRRLD